VTTAPIPTVPFVHLDEQGEPCTTHPPATTDALFALAIVGSRASGFNHDIASKLQGLMMALDEISEIAESDPNLARAAETAHASLKEVLGILNTNRAMTKAPARAPVALADLVTRAGERVYVTLKGALPSVDVEVSSATMIHAMSLVFDTAGGPGRGRSLPVMCEQPPGFVTLSLPLAAPMTAISSDALAIATFVLARDGGDLRCADQGTRFIVTLPVSK